MSEWWTYRLSDFLLFSTPTYRRLFALYNEEVWPAPLLGLLAAAAVLFLLLRRGPAAAGAACWLAATGWLWVAWAFHLQRYATINWAAPWFAAAFAVEAALLAGLGVAFGRIAHGDRHRPGSVRAAEGDRSDAAVGGAAAIVTAARHRPAAARIGTGLSLVALFAYPMLAGALGGSWRGAEVINLAPDPTALGTLGLLLLLPLRAAGEPAPAVRRLARAAWPVPLLWCAVSGATLWTLHAPEALLLPVAALLAAATAWRGIRR